MDWSQQTELSSHSSVPSTTLLPHVAEATQLPPLLHVPDAPLAVMHGVPTAKYALDALDNSVDRSLQELDQ